MSQIMAFSCNDWLSLVQNVFVSTEDINGHDLKDLLGTFPGITTLTINRQSIGFDAMRQFPEDDEGAWNAS
jgi:hypothetical protein